MTPNIFFLRISVCAFFYMSSEICRRGQFLKNFYFFYILNFLHHAAFKCESKIDF